MSSINPRISKLSGYAPAVPTPFDGEGHIDVTAFQHFCDRQIREGATALVVCGTTGEAPTLTRAEHKDLVRLARITSHGRVPIIAGAGSNATTHAVELTRDAEEAGADAILSVVPYYNKPTQTGLYAHFRTIAESTELPVILYDVPSRTACGLEDETIARLSELPQIIGLKDATGDVTRPARLRHLVGHEFRLLSGDDKTALAFFAEGGNGCISVVSNLAPGLCWNLFLAHKLVQLKRARQFADAIARLAVPLFRESNPVPLKYALSLFGLMSSKVRLPLVELSTAAQTEVFSAVKDACGSYAEYMIGRTDGSRAFACSDRHAPVRRASARGGAAEYHRASRG